MLETRWVYVVGVAVLGALVLARVLWFLSKWRRGQRDQLEHRRRFEAIGTATPFADPVKLARERGRLSIETHFTIWRRLAAPAIVVVTLAVVSLPFLSQAPASLVSLLVAAATVLIGIASRPFLENAIAGLALSSSKAVNIGDTVYIDKVRGTIEDISTTHTTVKGWDWRRYVVPNGQMLQSKFLNLSLNDTFQWAYVEFYVSYDADLETVHRLATEAATCSQYFADFEPPAFWVMGMERDAIRCWVAAWSRTPSEAWLLEHEMRQRLVPALREAGIAPHEHRLRLAERPGGVQGPPSEG
jgi:small-conductance mechanosensitive channel